MSKEPFFQNLKKDELERLDTLVSEYLLFRSYKQTQHQLFLDKRSPAIKLSSNTEARNQRQVISRILNSLDSGDYPRMITLWDSYVAQKIGTLKSTALNSEARDAEFVLNLCCAIYPFRPEVIETAGSPSVAAKVAARSMTIFKHFLETRGARLIQKGQEFAHYRNLYKIPFPPEHPQFSHMFTDEWYSAARERIAMFLEKFLSPSEEPTLCGLYRRLGTRDEEEMKSVFRRRERKLLRFARSLFSLSNDLLSALEEGKTVEKNFLGGFREKFNAFQEVLQPDPVFDHDMRGGESSPVNEKHYANRDLGGGSPLRQMQPSSELARKVHQKYDMKVIDYQSISNDVHFLLQQVGNEVDGIIMRARGISPGDAAVLCHTAMQGTVLLQALTQSILRKDKEVQPEAAANNACIALTRADVLNLRNAVSGDYENDIGQDNAIAQSRAVSKYLMILATATKRIPPFQSTRPTSPSVQQLPPYERLLTAGELVAEYLCRLVTAMGSTKSGVLYLKGSGVHLAIAITQLLVALPLPDFSHNVNVYSLDGNTGTDDDNLRPRSGNAICSWCIMALTTLAGMTKSHQLSIVKNGGIVWLSRALNHFVSEIQLEMRRGSDGETGGDGSANLSSLKPYQVCAGKTESTQKSSTSLFELCLMLLSIVFQSPDTQRSLVATLNMQKETEALVATLILLLMKTEIHDDHIQIMLRLVKILLLEVTTKDAAKKMQETDVFRKHVSEGTAMGVKDAEAKELIDLIDKDTIDTGSDSGNDVDVQDIMNLVWSAQLNLSESVILDRYINGAISGIPFLMRYSKKDGDPLSLFNEKFEPEEINFNTSESIYLLSPTREAQPPPKEMRSRPRLLRTPPKGADIPEREDHGVIIDDDVAEFKDEDNDMAGLMDKTGEDDEQEGEDDEEGEDEDEDEGDDDEDDEDDV